MSAPEPSSTPATAAARAPGAPATGHTPARAAGAPGLPGLPGLPSWFDGEDAPGRRDLDTCIHCGLCLTACPTYRELRIEPDSPRGRIYLMRGLADGRIEPSPELVQHLDQCLDCRACETVCPAGVPYSRMLEETRGQLARREPRGGALRAAGTWVLEHVLPHRERMHSAASLLGLGQRGPLAALMRSSGFRRWLPAFASQGYDMTPRVLPRPERALERVAPRLPRGARMESRVDALVFTPASTPAANVAFFTTCVMEVLFPRINQELVRLLVLAGARVTVPRAQSCCGALHAHAGLRRTAKDLARHNIAAFDAPYDMIVTDSAGCGAALREVGHLLHDDPSAEAAARFAARVRDVSEVLGELSLPEPVIPLHSATDARKPLRIAYHDPCHLAHAQKVRTPPRELLARIPGVELQDLPNSDWCCGSAGIYNLTHPDMADAQLEHKLDSIVAVAPELVVASNPGCALHMARGARARGLDARIVHLIEVLAMAYPAEASSR